MNWPGETRSPLLEAVHKPDFTFKVVEELVRRDAFIDFKGSEGWTPLMWASTWGRQDAVELLLQHGADTDCLNNENKSALHYAVEHLLRDRVFRSEEQPYGKICALLTPKTDLVVMFETAVLHDQLVMVDWLLSRVPVNVRLTEQRTALVIASSLNRTEIVRKLIAKNANIDLKDRFGRTALMEACLAGSTKTVRLLLNQNCDFNAQDEIGQTALLEATRQERKPIVKMLLRCGADPTIATKDGHTPISVAKSKNLESWYGI